VAEKINTVLARNRQRIYSKHLENLKKNFCDRIDSLYVGLKNSRVRPQYLSNSELIDLMESTGLSMSQVLLVAACADPFEGADTKEILIKNHSLPIMNSEQLQQLVRSARVKASERKPYGNK